ncbi:hypothetical protein R1flu_006539 [Riccia fluitans]|uniref:Uncharacterized protein n=1 Tax=Riccia fluitans TaxID=41844 RepID=A0ABD1YWA8_9MARC
MENGNVDFIEVPTRRQAEANNNKPRAEPNNNKPQSHAEVPTNRFEILQEETSSSSKGEKVQSNSERVDGILPQQLTEDRGKEQFVPTEAGEVARNQALPPSLLPDLNVVPSNKELIIESNRIKKQKKKRKEKGKETGSEKEESGTHQGYQQHRLRRRRSSILWE